MSQSEVFRPTQGDLLTRSALNEGYSLGTDAYRKGTASRPSTQGGYRFGQLSQNSFFTRHNPHPARVRHIKGLLDVPICAVNDNGYFSNPRYALQFPPNAFNQKKMERMPVNAINVNSQLHPINTVTGLQYFTGLSSYPFREKAIPKMGMVPVTEAWRDELKMLADAVRDQPPVQEPKREQERPKTQYSESTGRLIPPPSRAMSRQASRMGSRQGSRQGQRNPYGNYQHISQDPDVESMVLTMLCQILQTEDSNYVQSWLVSASEREKTMVMDMIKSAVANKDDYYNREYPAEFVDTENVTKLPPINEKRDDNVPSTINRLTVDENGPDKVETWKQPGMEPKATWRPFPPQEQTHQPQSDCFRPPTSDAFRKSPTRLRTSQGRLATPKNDAQQAPAESTLRYTTSAQGKRAPTPTGPVAPALAEETPAACGEQGTSQNTF